MMKAISTLMLAFAMLFVIAAPADAQQNTLQGTFNQAVKDYNAGNFEAAKTGFEAVLKVRPGYVYARNYLAKTNTAIKKGVQPATDTLETKIAALVVPKFSLENATLGSVLAFITQKSTELSGGKVTANFIYKGPAEDREKKMITLTLSNVPLTEVIRYVGLQAGVRFTYDKYAVIGTPIGEAQKADTSATPTQGAQPEAAGKQAATNPFP